MSASDTSVMLDPVTAIAPAARASRAQSAYIWLRNGTAFFRCVQDALQLACHSIDIEFYLYKTGVVGDAIRDLLVGAAQRNCRVRVLLDAYGADELPQDYWSALIAAGGTVRWFNPKRLLRLSFRNHRKLVVVDGVHAMLGGCNVGDEYAGDGVHLGWRDLGLSVNGGDAVHALQQSFAQMWVNADFSLASIARLRHWRKSAVLVSTDSELLLSGAGLNGARMRARLHQDISRGRDIRVLAAYFLPSRRLRRLLALRATQASIAVIVPANGDVALAHWARQHVSRKMLGSGIRFYEYQPAMLHAKLVIVDDVVYIGSANLDVRSHRINYELLLRVEHPELADQARAIFDSITAHSSELSQAQPEPPLWVRWRERLAYLMLSRLDPYIAQRKLRNLQ